MNKVMLIGNVGVEPDVRYYDQDQAVATVRLATTERGYTLQNGTHVPDRTDWHHLVFYRQLAKIVERYVHKGDKLYVEGKLRNRSYDDKHGMKRFITEVYVDNLELLTPKRGDGMAHEPAPEKTATVASGSTSAVQNEDVPF